MTNKGEKWYSENDCLEKIRLGEFILNAMPVEKKISRPTFTIWLRRLAWIAIGLIVLATLLSGCAWAETGKASYFSNVETHRRKCADGRYHDLSSELCVASWRYPLHSVLRIYRVDAPSVWVDAVVCDRGPGRKDGTSRFYKGKRIADLSMAAFAKLSPLSAGVIEVEIERL